MKFTEKQLQQINDLVVRYNFCTLETQQKLHAAGFFEKVRCNLHLCIFSNDNDCRVVLENDLRLYGNYSDKVLNYSSNVKVIIPMPTLGDIWDLLPVSIKFGYYLTMTKREVCYVSLNSQELNPDRIERHNSSENPCEAMCLLWLQLNEKGFIR